MLTAILAAAQRRSIPIWAIPLAPFVSLYRHRTLIWRLAGRELAARYRGSLLGTVWFVLLPVVMLGVYVFAFGVVFRARWPGVADDTAAFALLLFSGLTAFNMFGDTVTRAPTLILENVPYVKKVVFPLEVLPGVALATSVVTAAVSFAILAAAYPFVFGAPPWTVVLVPVVLTPMLLIALGASWALASLGVFLRDLRPVVGVVVTALLFLSPIFYPLQAVPEDARHIVLLNPFTTIMEQLRGVLFTGSAPSAGALAMQFLIGWLVALLGWAWFARTRKAFADVL